MASRQFVRVIVDQDAISSPPTRAEVWSDSAFRSLTWGCTLAIILLLVVILWEIGGKAIPAMREYGPGFLVGTSWDANKAHFGILPHIWGTLYSSLLALLIGGFAGIVIAVFLTQDFLPASIQVIFKNVVELLAAIPSVVYGLWGIFVLIPLVRPACDFLYQELSWIPFFGTSLAGPGMLPAALVLAIMILPTVAAISQDSLLAIPYKVKEAAYGMGTTRWEAILRVMLPTASHGIFGALVLGLGRALGETMGTGHAGRKFQSDQLVALLSCEYARRTPGTQFSGGRQSGDASLDVCRHCPPGDNSNCQRHRSSHHHLDQQTPELEQ